MTRRLLAAASLCAVALAASGAGAAETAPARAAEAQEAHAQGRYAEAARAYEAIARAEGVSPSLYYDLGVVQLAAGEIGPAILAFERAHWLAPRDAGTAAALAAAREKAGLPAQAAPWWVRLRALASPDSWGVAAGLLLAATCAGVAALLLAPATLRGRRALEATALACGAALLAALLACASLAADASRAIVLAPNLALRVAPFDTAEPRATLGAGDRVRLGERHGAFVRVDAGRGRAGWARNDEVGLIAAG